MILTKNFYVDTTAGVDLINIGHEVRRVVKEANAQEGSLTVLVPSPGGAVLMMEQDEKVEEIRKHLQTFLANGLIRCLLPKSLVVTVERGRLSSDPWQEIFLIDYEARVKRREFRVQVFVETPPKKGA